MAGAFADHDLIKANAEAHALEIITRFYPNARKMGTDIRWSLDGTKGTGCSYSTTKHSFVAFSLNGKPTDIVGLVQFCLGARSRNDARDWLRDQGYGNGIDIAPPEPKPVKTDADRRNDAAKLYADAVSIEGTPAFEYYIR